MLTYPCARVFLSVPLPHSHPYNKYSLADKWPIASSLNGGQVICISECWEQAEPRIDLKMERTLFHLPCHLVDVVLEYGQNNMSVNVSWALT